MTSIPVLRPNAWQPPIDPPERPETPPDPYAGLDQLGMLAAREKAKQHLYRAGCLAQKLERIVRAWRRGDVEEMNEQLRRAGNHVDMLLSGWPQLWDVDQEQPPF